MRHGLLARVPFASLVAAVLFAMEVPAQTVTWWDKGFDEALAAAKDSMAGMVLLYCWHDPNDNCSAMFGGTLSDKEVAPVLAEFVCMGPKDNDEAGRAVFARYGVTRVPTTLFLQPDGAVVDVVAGYVPVKEFVAEVARIRKGERTIAALRAAAAAKADDLAVQLELVRKLRAAGDKKGSTEVIRTIVAKDPKFASEPAAEARMLELEDEIFRADIAPQDYNLKPLRDFLVKQKNKRILFLGYDRLAAVEWKRDHLKEACEWAERAWKNVPPDQVAPWGQNVAAKAYEAWQELDKVDKTILKKVLEVSERAMKEVEKQCKASPDPAFLANAYYLHAAILVVNSQRKEAFALMDKAMVVDPKNENLKKAKERWAEGGR